MVAKFILYNYEQYYICTYMGNMYYIYTTAMAIVIMVKTNTLPQFSH